uniref:hypothetical protein n=1 Tax=uncultured Secundilactobacillus sp. TaxID=2813935 RepID=UPI00258D5B86
WLTGSIDRQSMTNWQPLVTAGFRWIKSPATVGLLLDWRFSREMPRSVAQQAVERGNLTLIVAG